VKLECIVVEQSAKIEIRDALPEWVRYIHIEPQYPDMQYNRSWAFNVGAKLAHGKLLVLHDNDMIVPQDYAKELLKRERQGYEVINLKRFIFYLTEKHTKKIFKNNSLILDESPEIIVQNLVCGGSIAVNRKSYFSIGGFDENFIGWGGEDIEFCERAQILRFYPFTLLPIVHLWHPPQAFKTPAKKTPAMRRYFQLSKIPPKDRVTALLKKKKYSLYFE